MADWSHVPARYRFVGGRRRINAQRRLNADERRHCVMLLQRADWSQRAIARLLGVHESQVSRDVALLSMWHFPAHVCRHCGVPFGRLALRPWLEDPEGLTPAGQQLLRRVHQVLEQP